MHIHASLIALFAMMLLLGFGNTIYSSSGPAIKLTEPALESTSSPITGVQVGQQLVITTSVSRGFDYEEVVPYVAFIEVRDAEGITQFLAFQSGKLSNQVTEIGTSWTPAVAGVFSLRTFAVSDLENPLILTRVYESTAEIGRSTLCGGIGECILERVTKIVDGDTLDVGDTRIRLALVNTPEIGELGYDESKAFTSSLCPVGSEVIVDEDDGQLEGSFDRMVAKVTCGDSKILNAELLYNGHAILLTEFCAKSEFSSEGWAQTYGCAKTVAPAQDCDPSYPDVCIPSLPPDLDCGDISYRNFRVLSPDPHLFDSNKDGIGCETDMA